jgi:hypothetical protein
MRPLGKSQMSVNPTCETNCPYCAKPVVPVKGEIYYFCPECWKRLDTGTEMRPYGPHLRRPHGQGSEGEGAKKQAP